MSPAFSIAIGAVRPVVVGIDAVQAGVKVAAIGEIDRGILIARRDLRAVTQQEGAVIVVGHVDRVRRSDDANGLLGRSRCYRKKTCRQQDQTKRCGECGIPRFSATTGACDIATEIDRIRPYAVARPLPKHVRPPTRYKKRSRLRTNDANAKAGGQLAHFCTSHRGNGRRFSLVQSSSAWIEDLPRHLFRAPSRIEPSGSGVQGGSPASS